MENQHRKIKGYRELSQAEIDLMNEVKEMGVKLGELHAKVVDHLIAQSADAVNALSNGEDGAQEENERQIQAEAKRWSSIAKTDLQTGLMALTRSIAQPGFF